MQPQIIKEATIHTKPKTPDPTTAQRTNQKDKTDPHTRDATPGTFRNDGQITNMAQSQNHLDSRTSGYKQSSRHMARKKDTDQIHKNINLQVPKGKNEQVKSAEFKDTFRANESKEDVQLKTVMPSHMESRDTENGANIGSLNKDEEM